MKHHVEEATRMKEIVTSELKENDEISQASEAKINFLKGELEKTVATNIK